MILKNTDFTLVSRLNDDEKIKGISQDYEILKYLTERQLYSEKMPDTISFFVETEGNVIGEVALKYIKWYNRKAELSLFLTEKHQGKGFGTKVLTELMKFAFNTMNFFRLEAEVVEYNKKAIKLVEKTGFMLEGRLREAKYFDGKYYDIFRYGILKREFEAWLKKNSLLCKG